MAGVPVGGLIADGLDDTPYIGATLTASAEMGIRLEIPFTDHPSVHQFDHVKRWLRTETPPTNLAFLVRGAVVSLFGLRVAGWSQPSHGAALLMLQASECVLAQRDGPLTDPFAVTSTRSLLDGLNDWAHITAVSSEVTRSHTNRAQRLTVVAETGDGVSWRQGDATLTLQAHWRTDRRADGVDRALSVADDVTLETSFESRRPFLDHLVEQRKVANLLVLLYGRAISFREHKIRDETFPERLASGEAFDVPFVQMFSARTHREAALPLPSRRELGLPLATLSRIGVAGLEEWARNYDNSKRFILPAVNALRRQGSLVEDVVLSTSTAIEAAGSEVGEQDGEADTYGRGGVTTATHAYRCLCVLDLPWGGYVDNISGLARAMADNYNDLKHADRGEFPDFTRTYLVSVVNRWVVRLLALRLAGSDDLLTPHRTESALAHVKQAFDASGLRVTADGKWEAGR